MAGNPELIAQYEQIHGSRVYGATSVKNLRFLRPEIQILAPRSILDYGCGQSRFLECLNLGYDVVQRRYDPAIPAYAGKPSDVSDLLINIDVLEHIEEQDLDAVLSQMRQLCRHAIIIIDTKPASAILPDGRNAHVTLRPHDWWREKLAGHFDVLERVRTVRRSRAGFKTWARTPGQTLRYASLRCREELSYWVKRATRTREQDAIASRGNAASGKLGS